MKAICPICGVEFEKKVHNQKVCSNLCFKEYRKEYLKTDKNKEYRKKYEKEYRKTDKRKEYQKEYEKEYKKEYRKIDKNKEYQKEYEKEYRKTDKYKEYRKEYGKNFRKNLSDHYIKHKLNMFDAPKELIEAKREQLKLFRLIKQMS